MRPNALRIPASLLLATATCVALTAASAPSVKQPDKLIILSTTDVKGKTSPCGCSTPKGGLSRRATFTDSMRADYGRIVVVDAGG